jgi:peroxiredoxin
MAKTGSAVEGNVINKSLTDQVLVKRMDFTLSDLEGRQQNISRWDNHVILLNFWATWCPPCRKEMPDFMQVYDEYKDKGFVVVGVGIDNKEHITDFVDTLGVIYPILVGELDAMKVSRQYGNRHGALPYSVIIDRNGMIRHKTAGLVSRNQLLSLIKPLL